MLGTKTALFLMVLLPLAIPQSFADSILVDFDKPEYQTGDSMTISGFILDFKMPVIAISIYDPDDVILTANNVDVDSDGFFTKTLFLDSPFYDKPGIYSVQLNYGKIVQTEFFIIDGETTIPELIPAIIPQVISLVTDKPRYYDNEFVSVSGTVSTLDSPSVLIGIYDQYETPMGFYFGEINSDLQFSTNFLVKSGVNFKSTGTYFIKAHYGESEKKINFDFVKKIETPKTEIPITPKIVPKTTPTKIDSPIIKNDQPKNNSEQNNSAAIPPKTNYQLPTPETLPDEEYDNLSVEDIELGIQLNQINLECDSSELVDTISYDDGMGPALYRLCKFDQSLEFFDNSLSKDPNNVEIITNKGSALRKLGNLQGSISYYDLALKIDPNFVPAINNKANALASMGKYSESISLYEKAIEKNPNYESAKNNLNLVLTKIPVENKIAPIVQMSADIPSQEIRSEIIPIKNISAPEPKSPSNIFEEIVHAFSSLGSLFGFEN
jgi:tetratricopeptide (TPR) repeat protein